MCIAAEYSILRPNGVRVDHNLVQCRCDGCGQRSIVASSHGSESDEQTFQALYSTALRCSSAK